MIIEMIYLCNFWLNAFPHPDGVSANLSPRSIVTGRGIDFNKHCRIEFGAYAQVHEDHDNSMATRTVGAIALRPTGNDQGSYYFFNLHTGQLFTRSRWTELPMPEDVIARVHKMSRRGRQGLEFLNRDGQPFIGPAPAATDNESNAMDNDDESFHPDDNDSVDQPPPVAPDIAGVYDEAGYDEADNHNLDPDPDNPNNYNILHFDNNENQEDIYYANILPDMNAEDAPAEDAPVDAQMINNPVNTGVPIAQEHTPNIPIAGVPIAQDDTMYPDDDDDDPVADIAAEMDEKYGPRTDRYNLRARKPRDYSHLYAIINSVC